MIIQRGMGEIGAYPSDSYYDPSRPSWMPYWMDTGSEEALKLGLYPGVNSLKPLPAPIAPVPQVPSGALDYAPGGSSTSVYLDPLGTTPDWFGSASSTMDRAARQIQNEEETAAKQDHTMLWVLGGAALVLVVISRRK